MNQSEAKEVITILLSADGGCPFCSADLVKKFVAAFPQYKEFAEAEYHNKYTGEEDKWDKS